VFSGGPGWSGAAGGRATAVQMLAHPFYDHGPNDKGSVSSRREPRPPRRRLGRASVVAIMGGGRPRALATLYRAVNPYVQVLKPISPLAWMPLFLYTIKDSSQSAILVIFMSSLWPTLANTAFGVARSSATNLTVAAILQLSWWRRLVTVICRPPRPRSSRACGSRSGAPGWRSWRPRC